jgi:hypothetical protein
MTIWSSKAPVVVRHDDASLLAPVPFQGVGTIKVHGCLQRAGAAGVVLTQSDYEDCFVKCPGMSARLATDLVRRSFLCIGYSYCDRNIRTVLVEARRLGNHLTQQRWLLLTRQDPASLYKDWSVRVRGLHPDGHPLGFRGLYLPAYRVGSRVAR